MQALVEAVGGGIELKFGDLKDPVRIHEKGIDDYTADHTDWDDGTVIPEACVVDVLRCRSVCEDGRTVLALEEMLGEGFETEVDGTPVRLELLRLKNKAAPTMLDPTHFRNLLNNVRFVYGSRSTFADCGCTTPRSSSSTRRATRTITTTTSARASKPTTSRTST